MTEQPLSQFDGRGSSTEPADPWRNEVQDRLARYKRRRGRRIEGAFTMRFPFPAEEVVGPAPGNQPALPIAGSAAESVGPDVAANSAQIDITELAGSADNAEMAPSAEQDGTIDFALEPPPATEEEPAIFLDPVPRPRPKRKVIAFPKHLSVAPDPMYRLADPVSAEAPRILDVPEELEAIPATPFLDGLGLDSNAVTLSSQRGRDDLELPYQPARISQRVTAAATDLAVVLAGVALSAAVAYRILEYPQLSKPLWLGLGAAIVVLWSIYQYMFLIHAGRTLGMMAKRLQLRTFKGEFPARKQRRLRVLALYFSTVSLGMGLMWAFADVDGFCWHDRLSRTFPTHQQ